MPRITTIELEHYFQAAHHLPDSDSLTTKKCLNLHGHTYAVRVFIEAEETVNGFVVDFGTIKQTVDQLDHATIVYEKDFDLLNYLSLSNSKMAKIPYVPTAENIAHWIYDLLYDTLPANAYPKEVWVCEGTLPGKTAWVKYTETED